MFNPRGAKGPLESSAMPGDAMVTEGGAQTTLGPEPVAAVQPAKVPVSNPGFTQPKAEGILLRKVNTPARERILIPRVSHEKKGMVDGRGTGIPALEKSFSWSEAQRGSFSGNKKRIPGELSL